MCVATHTEQLTGPLSLSLLQHCPVQDSTTHPKTMAPAVSVGPQWPTAVWLPKMANRLLLSTASLSPQHSVGDCVSGVGVAGIAGIASASIVRSNTEGTILLLFFLLSLSQVLFAVLFCSPFY